MKHPTQAQLEAGRQLGEALARFFVAMAGEPPFPAQASARPVEATDAEPLLGGTREAAKQLGVSQRMLWSLTAPRGPIPTVRIGRTVRYSISDLRDAIQIMKSIPNGEVQ